MKKILTSVTVLIVVLTFLGCQKAEPYPVTVQTWKSYKDVATYMESNWSFDKSTQRQYIQKLRKYKQLNGGDLSDYTVSELSMTPKEAYNSGSGFCGDSAVLIKDALNKINPSYNAKIIFIWNGYGKPHHWVTGFYVEDKLYVMDYGTGSHWSEMMGTHGPYNSLDEYGEFLKTVNANNFKFGSVEWRD